MSFSKYMRDCCSSSLLADFFYFSLNDFPLMSKVFFLSERVRRLLSLDKFHFLGFIFAWMLLKQWYVIVYILIVNWWQWEKWFVWISIFWIGIVVLIYGTYGWNYYKYIWQMFFSYDLLKNDVVLVVFEMLISVFIIFR